MAEYISKDKFEELMRKKARNNFDLYYADKSKYYYVRAIGYSLAADEAHDFPAADVQPVKHGKWGHGWEHGKCTNCEKSLEDLFEGDFYYDCEELHFCPNCGARLGGDKE